MSPGSEPNLCGDIFRYCIFYLCTMFLPFGKAGDGEKENLAKRPVHFLRGAVS